MCRGREKPQDPEKMQREFSGQCVLGGELSDDS